MKKGLLIFSGIIVILFILVNLPTIITHLEKYSLDRNKEVTTEIKVVTEDELFDMGMQQMKSTQKLVSSIRYSLVGEESRDGLDELWNTYHFIYQHPEVKSIEIELPITRYKDNNKTIEFISGKVKILKVLEKGEWKEHKNTQ